MEEEWQILHVLEKKGHTREIPKLRGIAAAILDQRFMSWYVPNNEQAGFRNGQGCLLLARSPGFNIGKKYINI